MRKKYLSAEGNVNFMSNGFRQKFHKAVKVNFCLIIALDKIIHWAQNVNFCRRLL